MQSIKPYKTIEEQIDLLKSRKVFFPNEKLARRVLSFENYYYVVNGYKDPFVNSTVPEDSYKPGVTFNELVALYSFDRKLRELLLIELLRIEHVVKAQIIITFSKYHGQDHTSYLRPESFNVTGFENFKRTNALIFEMLKLIDRQRARHGAINHYLHKYGFVPLWVLSKVMTFGKLNSFYGCMRATEKEEVANEFHLSSAEFKSMIDFLADFRNRCAHSERIFCHSRDQRMPRPIPDTILHSALKIPQNQKGYKYGKCDILALLIAMKYFSHRDRYDHLIYRISYALNEKLKRRLHSIPCSDIQNIMGLIGTWQDISKFCA
jgi:Abortive infection bacteriophage resistance protein